MSSSSIEDIKAAEEKVLIRALRDSNIPKIIDDDLEVFMGLIGDLFPGVDIPRLVNEPFEQTISKCARESNLQADKSFVLKVVQLEELLIIRHSVFILGNAGTGKSQCWKILAKTYQAMGRKILTPSLNPKAVTTKELYGYINQQTREWHDGLFSIIMRDMSNIQNNEPKWIVLDGDIDPCVAAGELVSDIHGIGHKIESVVEGDCLISSVSREVLNHNSNLRANGQTLFDIPENHNQELSSCEATRVKQTGIHKEIFELRTCSGRKLRITSNHKLIVMRKSEEEKCEKAIYVTLDQLLPGDKVLEGPTVDCYLDDWAEFTRDIDTTSALETVYTPVMRLGRLQKNTALALVRLASLSVATSAKMNENLRIIMPMYEGYTLDAIKHDVAIVSSGTSVEVTAGLLSLPINISDMLLDLELVKVSNNSTVQFGNICSSDLPSIVVREILATLMGVKGEVYKITESSVEPGTTQGLRGICSGDMLRKWFAQVGISCSELESGTGTSFKSIDECFKFMDRVGTRFTSTNDCGNRANYSVITSFLRQKILFNKMRDLVVSKNLKDEEEFISDADVLDMFGNNTKFARYFFKSNMTNHNSDVISKLNELGGKPLAPVSVMSVTPVGHSCVYDISTMSNSFIAGGILVHNCWIESLNTVMDDNKTLTLASNERIPLNDSMRLIFEIGDLKYATPATVSRAGIIYINGNDVGYTAFFLSWLEKRDILVNNEKIILQSLYEKYVTPTIEWIPRHFKSICPMQPITYIETLCRILDAVLIKSNLEVSIEASAASGTNTLVKDVYENYFVFACIWSFGGPLFKDQLVDYRSQFNQWFRGEFKPNIPLGLSSGPVDTGDKPSSKTPRSARGTNPMATNMLFNSVFDYLVKINGDGTPSWVPWDSIKQRYDPSTSVQNNISDIIVATTQTSQLHYMLDIMLKRGHPVLFAGFAGSGKSVLMTKKLKDLAESTNNSNASGNNITYMYQTINLNYYTTTAQLQMILESNLEKKSGRTYAPSANKTIIVHIDDLNMAQVDMYGTQAPITLLRQHKDYNAWYDREKMTLKLISNMQHVACMNPSAGSFTINPRYQRHFSVFSVDYPNTETLKVIYGSILTGYFSNNNGASMNFNSSIINTVPKIVQSLLLLHEKVLSNFMPTAIKFHYQFNLRDLSNICDGLMRAVPGDVGADNEGGEVKHLYSLPQQLIRLYAHEACRVYRDRLISEEDSQQFDRILSENLKSNLTNISSSIVVNEDAIVQQPYIYSTFSQGVGVGDDKYSEVDDYLKLKRLLEEALEAYNEENAKMDLVLFEDAMDHVNRINRIITSEGYGNALLIGVGGSGKQSLAKLAANMAGYEVFMITISSSYGVSDFKLDLQQLYIKAGVKSSKVLFIFTDSQIVDEEFLVFINDLLSSGNIIGLFGPDEEEGIINGLRNEVKASGLIDTKENCWSYFINKVKKNLHVVLGFSPVGDSLRVRARKFPALVNCCTIDWFHPWPHEALFSVAQRFINRLNSSSGDGGGGDDSGQLFPHEDIINNISRFMADTTNSVDTASKEYLLVERRRNYTTPKSFLELISLYSKLLIQGNKKINEQIERLEAGNIKLAQTERDVSILKDELNKQKILVEERKQAADELLEQVGKDTAYVEERRKDATVEAERCAVIKKDVEEQQADCMKELEKAEPAVIAAEAALNTLNKNNLVELKSFGKPSDDVVGVMKAVIWLLSNPASPPRDFSWNAAKKLMGDVQKFLKILVEYDKNSIDPNILKNVKPIVEHPQFNGAFIKAKSVAAAGICEWARNVVIYYEIYKEIVPKREKLAEANKNLEAAQAKLSAVEESLAKLDKKLQQLTKKFEDGKCNGTEAERMCDDDGDGERVWGVGVWEGKNKKKKKKNSVWETILSFTLFLVSLFLSFNSNTDLSPSISHPMFSPPSFICSVGVNNTPVTQVAC